MTFDFTPLPPANGLAHAQIRCRGCSHVWELQSENPVPHGTYRTQCSECQAEGSFRCGPAEAMGLPLDVSARHQAVDEEV